MCIYTLPSQRRNVLTNIDKYIIDKVREKRLEKGISQAQLAFELEQSNSFIAKVESGKYDKKYNMAHVNRIAQILECDIWDIVPQKPVK